MQLRLKIVRAEVKLFGLLVIELVVLNPLAAALTAFFPEFLFFLWILEGGGYFKPIGIYLSILVAAVISRNWRLGHDAAPADTPVRRPLSSYPALRELVRQVASRFHKSAPKEAILSLSPVPWRRFGVDLRSFQHPARGLPLPLACLEIWSVSELEAYISRTLVLYRGPSWLLKAVASSVNRLRIEQSGKRLLTSTHWTIRVRSRLLTNILETLKARRFLVDADADLKVARALGAEVVISLAYKTELANAMAPPLIANVADPALDKQALLPIAESYAAHASAVDPLWGDAVSGLLRQARKSEGRGRSPFVSRLALLSNLPAGIAVQDPRPARSVFSQYAQLEREVAASECGEQRVGTAVKVEISDWARLAIIPQLKDEVDRNQEILAGKTRFDIPKLLLNKTGLAPVYRSDPKFLFGRAERQQRISYLLGAFLALSLFDEEWAVSFTTTGGIQFQSGQRQIQPFSLVRQLDAQAIAEDEFFEQVR